MVLPQVTERNWSQSVFCSTSLQLTIISIHGCVRKIQNPTGCNLTLATQNGISLSNVYGFGL